MSEWGESMRLKRYQSEAPNPVGKLSCGVFFIFIFIYLTAQGLGYGTRDLHSLLWHAGSFFSFLVAACMSCVI